MSFLDKFFIHKNVNRNENELKSGGELLRDCNRRGRKLLFDSNAVEKTPLPLKKIECNQNSQQESNQRNTNFIETTDTHSYKYKKVSNDIACLGEMIFGSVAMAYKGENLCKIHKIPSPKQLMFTTIIYAPIRCHIDTINECSLENSIASMYEVINQKETSSDSKLYRNEGGMHKCSSIYPCIKNISAPDKITQCCDANETDFNLTQKPFLRRGNKLECVKSLFLAAENDETSMSTSVEEEKSTSRKDFEKDFYNLNLPQKSSGCDGSNPGSNADNAVSSSSLVSSESDNVSSVSGSLSSLRRRWAQSCSSSLDSTASKDINNTPCKKRAKLAMALVLDLSNSKDDEMEKFLFNHTILIDGIISKLRTSVELAYIKNQNFVDLLYTAFLDARRSIFDLITVGKYSVPVWMGLLEEVDSEDSHEGGFNSLDGSISGIAFGEGGASVKKAKSSDCFLGGGKLNFLNDFQDVLVRFDTKDTNFFITTLLTAVLTHHLSWVSFIAETEASSRQEKMECVVKNYNPIWAQLNDLYGLLGSPLKCAKTIVTGSEGKRNQISAIIRVLTYFIRCFNVVENVWEVEIEEIVGEVEESANRIGIVLSEPEAKKKNFDRVLGRDSEKLVEEDSRGGKEEKSSEDKRNVLKSSKSVGNLRRDECLAPRLTFENSVSSGNIYPDIREWIKSENMRETDSDFRKSEIFQCGKSIDTTRLKPPDVEVKPSPADEEGFDTIDFCKTECVFEETKIVMEKQNSAPADSVTADGGGREPRENIFFTVGDDEKSVKSYRQKEFVLIEPEEGEDVVPEKCDRINFEEFSGVRVRGGSERDRVKESRTFDNLCEMDEGKVWAKVSAGKEDNFGVKTCCCNRPKVNNYQVPMEVRELNLPRTGKNRLRREQLDVSSVFGGVNREYNSEQIIQGVTDCRSQWEQTLQKDLFLCAYNSIVEKDVTEAVCIVGDLNSWEVSVRSSTSSTLDRSKRRSSGFPVGMSQLVADMLESFLFLRRTKLSPDFCFLHIEKKLREIYAKSKTIAEILDSTEFCTIDYLTSRLDVGVDDIPLLLSVATTHSPRVSDKYGLSFG